MKSPYQIAKEIGVSPQAIYKKLNSKFNSKLNKHIKKDDNGKMLIDSVGERILKESFDITIEPVVELVEQQFIEPVQQPTELVEQLQAENQYLREQLEIANNELLKQSEHVRKQSDQITILANQLVEITKNNQILLKQEQDKNLMLESKQDNINFNSDEAREAENKKGIWNKLFKKKSSHN